MKGASHGFDMLRLSRWLAAFDARIVHFQWSPVPLVDSWIIHSFRRRNPVILTLHDSEPYLGDRGAATWLMRQGYGSLLHAVDAIIVHTQQAERRVAAIGIDRALIYRIPHGLLLEQGHPTRRPARRSGERLILLQFGKIKAYKGIDLLLKALTLIPREMRSRLDVRIIGKPYIKVDGIQQFVTANELTGCVTLCFEFVSEAEQNQLFAEADAVVLPYHEIDASGVAMSAIARGVPVLATAIAGFRELFEGEGGACLVPPADPAGLASAITGWINAPEQLDVLEDAMRLRRSQIPTWDEIARLHFAVYAEAHARWKIAADQRRKSSGGLAPN
jgi:glycosyltransferase involved in cell wall biosynthesis